MLETNGNKIEFGQKAKLIQEKEMIDNYNEYVSQNCDYFIKITQKVIGKNQLYGHKKVNFMERTSKIIYRKINKMLGKK